MRSDLGRRAFLAAGLAPALPRLVAAQDAPWRPTRPVRLVNPSAAGGTGDALARIVGQFLSPRLGQPIVVDNKPGAGGAIGTMDVLRSPADGYTMLLGNVGAQGILYSIARNVPYTAEELAPVTNVFLSPHVLVVHPSVEATTVAEFIALIRANPDKYSYGTPGLGQSPHLAALWFSQLIRGRTTAVHYRGSSPANIDLYGGRIQFHFDLISNQVEAIAAGRVRALATTGPRRNPALPNVPIMREVGPEFANFTTGSWVGLFAAKGTPANIIRTYNMELREPLQSPETAQRFLTLGGVPDYQTPEQFTAFVNTEIAKWAGVIREEGLRVDLT